MYRALLPVIWMISALRLHASDDVETAQRLYADLTTQRDHLLTEATRVGESGTAPHHLRTILKYEDLLWRGFLKTREEHITRAPEWKRHVIASVTAYSTARFLADNAARSAAWSAVVFAPAYTQDAASRFKARDAMGHEAYRSVWNIANHILLDTSAAIVNILPANAANNNVHNAAWQAAWDALGGPNTLEDSLHVRDAVNHAIAGGATPIQAGRIAYRFAEAEVWIAVLDPAQGVFNSAYTAAYLAAREVPLAELDNWFASQETFESQVDTYFIHDERHREGSVDFVQPIASELKRIGTHIFSLSKIPTL